MLEYDDIRYIEYISKRLEYLAKHFKLTSEIEKGVVHRDYFFGNNGEEILISSHELFNVRDAAKNWKDLKSVRVITTDRNDTKLLLPLGKDDGCRAFLSTIFINLPMLAIQYREFIREQMLSEEDLRLTKNNFVMKYILPNMMSDVIDHMFLNSVIDRFYGLKKANPRYHHRFKIFEPYAQLEKYSKKTLSTISNKKIDFVNILHNIQLVFNIDSSSLLALPDIGYTRQVKWALYVSRLKYMVFMYDVAKSKNMNKHYINDWKRLTKRMEREHVIDDMFSFEVEDYVRLLMDRIKTM
jgi:hypothetical protein